MIKNGDIVCAGVSGGKDSVCMLYILYELRPIFGYELRAFHVDHGLRGEESNKDRLFVGELCDRLGIRLYVFEHDVNEYAKQIKTGTEEAGRILRLGDAKSCLNDGCTKIALAHHKNDQAETFLFHLSRGSSIFGMTGIRPVNEKIIHPMLAVTGKEISSYLTQAGIEWRTDQTNYDTGYTRNFIRHELIPLMEDRLNPKTTEHIASAAEDMIQAEKIIKDAAEKAFDTHVRITASTAHVSKELTKENVLIVRSVLLLCMERLSGKRKDLSRIHAEETRQLFFGITGRRVSLPYGLYAHASYGDVIIRKSGTEGAFTPEVPFVPGERVTIGDYVIVSEYVNDAIPDILEKNKYTKCFDYDKILDSCVYRTRKEGDFLVIDGGRHKKKLKDFFIDSKTPRAQRDSCLLLATGNTVHWVLGLRMGDSAKVTENSKRIVKISYYRKENNGSKDF